MEIIQFKNGNYGIRKRTTLDVILNKEGKFMDFHHVKLKFWRRNDIWFNDCQVESLEKVHEKIEEITEPLVLRVVGKARL